MERKNFKMRQGDTFRKTVRWETHPFVYVVVTGITNAAPAVVHAPDHGLTEGWRAAVVSVEGMDEINAHNPLWDSDLRQVTIVSPDYVSFNDINSSDYGAYSSGGYLQFYTPVDMLGYTARMIVRDFNDTILAELTTENGGITIDNDAKTISLYLETTDMEWTRGQYDLEMIGPTDVTDTIFTGSFTLTKDIA